MTPSLSVALFSALLTTTSPAEGGTLQNGELLPINGVRDSVEQCMKVWEWIDINNLHEIFLEDLNKHWLVSVLESISRVPPLYSKHELYTIVTPIVEQSIYEMQSQIQENKGFIQISKNHWMSLWNIASDETREWKDRLIAAIRLITIVNFFTFLWYVYYLNVDNVRRGKKTPSILFWGFFISNALGTTSLFLAETPLEWVGYGIATIGAVASFFYIRRNEKNNLHDEAFMEHMEQHTAFSIYDIEGKALEFSPKLLKILGYTKEEVFSYQKEHGEIVTLFYPDIEEQERIAAYQSEHTKKWQAYQATFFPRRKDGKKIALHFHTIPRVDKKKRVIGTYRFAEDVTRDHRNNIDLLTGAFDKTGFEKRFHDILTKKKTRWINQNQAWSVSIVYSDLDSFKSINDIYNHDNADVVLKEFVKMAYRYFREEDLIARFWGDEFGIICDNSHKEVILLKFNKLRDEFSRSTFEITSGCLIENGFIIHNSYGEALKYQEKRNSEIKENMENQGKVYDRFTHCCIGGVGITGGVTDFTYNTSSFDEKDIPQKLIFLKKQAERVMNLIKYLEFLGIDGVSISKNGVGMPILDDKQEIIGVEIYNGIWQVEIDRETLAKATEAIAEGVKKITQYR